MAASPDAAELHRAPTRRRGKAKKPRRSLLRAFEDLPPHLQDNNFILKGYRASQSSAREVFRSLFSWHNETGNIWTHLFGFLLFVALTVFTAYAVPAPLNHAREAREWLQSHFPHTSWSSAGAGQAAAGSFQGAREQVADLLQGAGRHSMKAARRLAGLFSEDQLRVLALLNLRAQELGRDTGALGRALAAALQVPWPTRRWPMHVFTAGACTCLFLSSFCHLLGSYQFRNTQAIWRLDYAGIVILIVTSFVPSVHYSFLCRRWLRTLYLGVTMALGSCTLCVTLLSVFQTRKLRPVRASLFLALGGWGVVPAVHAFVLHSQEPHMRQSLLHTLGMGLVYVAGAVIYATRVPERWKPGYFDLAFHSHQLFHVAVVLAALVHYKGLRWLLAWRDAQGGACEPMPLQAVVEPLQLGAPGNLSLLANASLLAL